MHGNVLFLLLLFLFVDLSGPDHIDTIQQQINKFLHALIIEIQNVVVL